MEAVIFDMDGVLIDSEPIHRVVEESLFREHRIPVTPDEHDGYLGTSSIDMFRAIAAAHPGPWKNAGLTIEEWIALEQERYGRELFSGRVPFVPGALETVRTLAREGWKIAVASSAPRRQIEFVGITMGEIVPVISPTLKSDHGSL